MTLTPKPKTTKKVVVVQPKVSSTTTKTKVTKENYEKLKKLKGTGFVSIPISHI